MLEPRITRAEAERPVLPWDTSWDAASGIGDWSVESRPAKNNAGGLKADRSIETAIILSLFTDRRAPKGWRPEITDRRGWWGDHVSPTGEVEEEWGSWLWLLTNEILSDDLALRAKTYAEDSLKWMLRDGVAGEIKVASGSLRPTQGIWLTVDVFSHSGERIYNQRFERLWRDAGVLRKA